MEGGSDQPADVQGGRLRRSMHDLSPNDPLQDVFKTVPLAAFAPPLRSPRPQSPSGTRPPESPQVMTPRDLRFPASGGGQPGVSRSRLAPATPSRMSSAPSFPRSSLGGNLGQVSKPGGARVGAASVSPQPDQQQLKEGAGSSGDRPDGVRSRRESEGLKAAAVSDEVANIKHQLVSLSAVVKSLRQDVLGLKDSVQAVRSIEARMAGAEQEAEDRRQHFVHEIEAEQSQWMESLFTKVQDQLGAHRLEMLEQFEKDNCERDEMLRVLNERCERHMGVLAVLDDSLRTHHARFHKGRSLCLRPGCGKLSWSRKSDDWCSTVCRDTLPGQDLEFFTQAFDSFTQSIGCLHQNVKRLDEKPGFFTTYKTVSTPLDKIELFDALDRFLQEWSRQRSISVPERIEFFSALKSQADHGQADANAREHHLTEVEYIGASLWTSDHRLRGVALCNMLCQANRDDIISLLTSGGIAIQKALNSALTFNRLGQVPQRLQPPRHWNFETHRGSKLHSDGIKFFRDLLAEGPGLWRGMYRTPAPLASSLAKSVAEKFVAMEVVHAGPVPVGGLVPVLFLFRWENEDGSHNDPPCVHARYIDRVSALQGEEEMLLAAYSVFVVCEIREAIPAEGKPMEIVVRVCEDNRSWPEFLPLAKWH